MTQLQITQYQNLKFQNFQKQLQGWKVTEYDLRKESEQPESYIFRITK